VLWVDRLDAVRPSLGDLSLLGLVNEALGAKVRAWGGGGWVGGVLFCACSVLLKFVNRCQMHKYAFMLCNFCIQIGYFFLFVFAVRSFLLGLVNEAMCA